VRETHFEKRASLRGALVVLPKLVVDVCGQGNRLEDGISPQKARKSQIKKAMRFRSLTLGYPKGSYSKGRLAADRVVAYFHFETGGRHGILRMPLVQKLISRSFTRSIALPKKTRRATRQRSASGV
jgi:hypothetical protein